MSKRTTMWLALCVAIVASDAAHGAVISIGASKDNTLYQDAAGALSNGAGQRFFAGTAGNGGIRRGLLAFDIASAVPAGSTINSVSLRLNMSNTSGGPAIIELRPALQNWGEGTSVAGGGEGGGGPSTAGDATWLHTFFNTSFWTNPGGDFSATPSASLSVGGVGAYTWASNAQFVADVQNWLDNPGTNFGWVVLGDEATSSSAKRFDSLNHATPANRPLLTIDYSPVPEPACVGLLLLGAIGRRRLRSI